MVDEDKLACQAVTEQGYKVGMWPDSYLTWDFLIEHPKAMELGYFHLNWNHIPGMYCHKSYLHSLVIEQEEWDCLSDPTHLAHYWEPTQEPGDFHRTFVLVLCQSKYSDCDKVSRREESIMSVAVIRKPARLVRIPFTSAAEEFSDPAQKRVNFADSTVTPSLPIISGHLF